MDRNFLKQSIRRELDYYKDGLFNEDEDEYWECMKRNCAQICPQVCG